MEWLTSEPEKPGKYIVETKTMMGNRNVIEAFWNGEGWSFTRQTFVKYLKQ
jgi:hypothetical protein